MNQRSTFIRASALLVWLIAVAFSNRIDAQMVRSLQSVPAGTIVVDPDADHWNELILLAWPSLTSGDLDRLPSGLQQAVTRYAYTVLATVTNAPPPGQANAPASPYRLAEVGVGYSAQVDGMQTIVSATQTPQGSLLGIIDRQVVAQNERDLEQARVVVRSSTLMMFDMEAILARENGHRPEPLRTLVWIDPQTGKSAIAMWLLKRRDDGPAETEAWDVREDPMQVHPGGKRAHNRLHVDASTFVLGIPTATSFGLERLLPGRQITWTDELSELAGKSSSSPETLAEFTTELNQAIQSVKTGRETAP